MIAIGRAFYNKNSSIEKPLDVEMKGHGTWKRRSHTSPTGSASRNAGYSTWLCGIFFFLYCKGRPGRRRCHIQRWGRFELTSRPAASRRSRGRPLRFFSPRSFHTFNYLTRKRLRRCSVACFDHQLKRHKPSHMDCPSSHVESDVSRS